MGLHLGPLLLSELREHKGFRFKSLGFRAEGLKFKVQGWGGGGVRVYRVLGLGFRLLFMDIIWYY